MAEATEKLKQTEEKIAKLRQESQDTEKERKKVQNDVDNT